MQQQRPADTGSRTLTISRSATPDLARAGTAPTTASESEAVESPPVGVLRLRGGPTGRRRVVWRDDTVDNEGMGKKKSKICCIYHRPRAFDESSTESSSGSDDDNDNDNDDGDGDGDSHHPKAGAGPSGSGRTPKAPRGIMKRREGGGEVEQSSESDSDGGQGDGRARPARKPRRKHRHSRECDHGPGDHAHGHSHGHKHASKPNRYDHQEKHGTPGQAVNT